MVCKQPKSLVYLYTSSLVKRWSRFPDHGLYVIDNGVHVIGWMTWWAYTTLLLQHDQVTKFIVSILRNRSRQIFRPWDHINHYLGGLPWLHELSHRNRVILKVYASYSDGIGWGLCINIGICSPAWREDTLGPTRWDFIQDVATHD